MKWLPHRHGDERTVKKFLLFPLTLPLSNGNSETRWLEMAAVVEKYDGAGYATQSAWEKVRWA